jgi:hypothetical protein
MIKSPTAPIRFAGRAEKSLAVDFLGGRQTSDGGLVWIAEADEVLGLTDALASVIPDWRRHRGRHDLKTLVTQRVYQIACGYEDQDDADTLRVDPLLKQVCGRLPESGADLASQPTFSRMEHAISRTTCYRIAQALGACYLRERERIGKPTHLVLELDGTDDPTYGEQEQAAYHGYYRQHQYFPLLVFDGETDQLITAVLRPGAVHASRGIVPILHRIVGAVRACWPEVSLEIRADCGFAIPALYDYCETERIGYTIGIAKNARLLDATASLQAEAEHRSTARNGEKVRLFGETTYQAESWPKARRVIVKAEHLTLGPNTRFVVTTRTDSPEQLYTWYTKRGASENWIKDLKRGCFADRLSCHTFWANQFRLLLHAAAYALLDTVRRWLQQATVPRMTLETLRLRLIKIAGWVRERQRDVRMCLAASHPNEGWWHLLATIRQSLMNNPG